MDVLIVEDEIALLESLKDGLSAALPDYAFAAVPSVEQAEAILDDDALPSLVVSDIRLPGKSGLEFLVSVRRSHPDVQFILISAFPFTVPSELARTSRGIRFLRKPFELSRLIEEVRLVLEGEQFRGNVEGIHLTDLLQVLHFGKRTAAVRVERRGQSGALYVEDGEIVHALQGWREGTEAFKEIVTWKGGSYSVESDTPAPARTVAEPFNFLLLEAMRQVDEERRDASDSDELSLTEDNPEDKEANRMADLNELCKGLVESVTDAVAANVVDLSTGMMLAGHFVSNFTSDHFEAVSAAATNLYRGRETLRVEELVKSQRGDTSDTHFMEEVQFSTTHLHHFITKLAGKEAILCLVTKKPGNIGMGWSAVRSAAPKVAPLVPS